VGEVGGDARGVDVGLLAVAVDCELVGGVAVGLHAEWLAFDIEPVEGIFWHANGG
jgi:hypothetical protein